jgi:ADP-L-glycero-D-manno-heptose 6-epimerase
MLYPEMSILVTGAYGFIGSQFVKFLNSKGFENIIVSDYLTNGKQFKNLNGAKFYAYRHPDVVLKSAYDYDCVFHFGAVSDTTCWDGELVMQRNYNYTLELLRACIRHGTPLSYSSSASVYGNGDGPLNLYAYSKALVDDVVADTISSTHNIQVQGFRYFNVYGLEDEEWHKGDQASPFYKFKQQVLNTGRIELFEGSENFKRDFIHVSDVCRVQFEMAQRSKSGIFDLGTGYQQSFKDVADQVVSAHGGEITTIPFPDHLKGHYQVSTRADMSYL